MIRRFVNLVTQNPRSNNGAYSLHRLDVAKHLFYPSTAEAEAAAAAANAKAPQSKNNNGGEKPIDSLGRLPNPTVRFQQVPPTPKWRPLDDMFVLLNPGAAASAGDRILHFSKGGHGEVYDAASGSVVATVPSPTLDGPNRVGFQPITFSIAAAAAGEEEEKQDSRHSRRCLYVMTDNGAQSFQCLDLSNFENQNQNPPNWEPLPPAPFAVATAAPAAPSCITAFTTINSGTTIVVSTVAKGTFCFDTHTRQWRHAGDWALPFDGRAHFVPELDAWLGFKSSDGGHVIRNGHHHLCASTDLAAAAMNAGEPPTVQHVWDDDLELPRDEEEMTLGERFGKFHIKRWDEWFPYGYYPHGGHELVSLGGGGGRFCVAKAFRLKHMREFECDYRYCNSYSDPERLQPFETVDLVVLTGVEVLRGGDGGGGGGLRMVRHKSRRYDFTSDADEIKWVL